MDKTSRNLLYRHVLKMYPKYSTIAAVWNAAGAIFCEPNNDPFITTSAYPELEKHMDLDLPIQERWDSITTDILKQAIRETAEYEKHEIKTVQDMIDCTTEDNLDAFLKDLKTVIQSAHSLQKIFDNMAINEGVDRVRVTSEGFTWIDDSEDKFDIIYG